MQRAGNISTRIYQQFSAVHHNETMITFHNACKKKLTTGHNQKTEKYAIEKQKQECLSSVGPTPIVQESTLSQIKSTTSGKAPQRLLNSHTKCLNGKWVLSQLRPPHCRTHLYCADILHATFALINNQRRELGKFAFQSSLHKE